MKSTLSILARLGVATALLTATACGDVEVDETAAAAGPATQRVIVKYKNGLGRAAAVSGGAVHLDLTNHNAVAVTLPSAAIAALASNPNIDFVEQDAPRYPLGQEAPYGIELTQADQVADTFTGDRKVCIIDSGYALGHEDLPGLANVSGTDDSGAGPWSVDGFGHGTHVAGTIVGLNNGVGVVGVAPNNNLKLHIVRVFGDDGAWAYSSTLVKALDDCIANGANVVSMSLGGSMKSRTEDKAFSGANSAGVLSIAAAGNDGNMRKSYPASYSSVVSVAAIDSNKVVASFSQQNDQVELSAPGVAVRSTVPVGHGLESTVTAGTSEILANGMDGSPAGTSVGILVDCGIGDSTCPGGGGQICLIQRGTISFANKVLACIAGGGAAAIVYNNEPGALLGTLGGTAGADAIISTGVSDTEGAFLLTQLGTSVTVANVVSNYAAWDGTSMATPHVSGVAALVWSHHLDCSNDEIRNALTTTADDLGAAGRDNAYGYGLIQAAAANDYLTANVCGGGGGGGGGGGSCVLAPVGASCSSGADCCSGNCKGKPDDKTCR